MDEETAAVYASHVSVGITLDNGERYIGRIVEHDVKSCMVQLTNVINNKYNHVLVFYNKVSSIEFIGAID